MRNSGKKSHRPAAALGRVLLFRLTIAVAVAIVATGLAVAPPIADARPGDLGRWAIAAALVAVALLARVRVRTGTTRMFLGWGEAAVIVAVGLVDTGWVPSAVLVGAGSAMIVLRALGEVRSPSLMAYNAASLALAGAAAAGVALAIHDPYRAALSLGVVAALIAAAVTYALVSIAATAAAVCLVSGAPLAEVLGRAARGKAIMIAGNISAGLAILVIVNADLRWLLVLPPVLWLLRLAYSNRLGADDERSGWRAFAVATQALNRLDERGVAEAGIAGAVRLFGACCVEVALMSPEQQTSYRSAGVACTERLPGRHASRPLLVAGNTIGELRLWFATPTRLSEREQARLSAYGDALAAALHDAAAHRELVVMAENSSRAASRDPLTGLANRAALLGEGDVRMRLIDKDAPVAMVVLDVAHFREVNDTLGHTAGDEVLRISAARIAANARAGEVPARVGGDEFALLIVQPPGMRTPGMAGPAGGQAGTGHAVPGPADPGHPDPDLAALGPVTLGNGPVGVTGAGGDAGQGIDGAGEAAMRAYALARAADLLDLLAARTEVSGVPVVVEASIGIAVATAGGCDATELLRRATIATRRAKDGNGPVTSYEGDADEASTDRLALLAELREALAGDHQLVLVFQPVIDLRTGVATGAEALIRWRHPRRGELSPAEFIDVMEKSELVGLFGRYVIDRALRVAAQWAAQGLAVPISVNLSARNLLDRHLPDHVADMLARHRVPASMLVLEITETVMVPENEAVGEVLGRLRQLGVQLAIDDFGTGFSSLSFLTRVQVDEVKVDQTFVARMAESAQALAIVRTTVDLARNLDLRVVAEGVETAEQRAMLMDLGCYTAQGFHFFRPLAPEKAAVAIRALSCRVIPLRTEGAS